MRVRRAQMPGWLSILAANPGAPSEIPDGGTGIFPTHRDGIGRFAALSGCRTVPPPRPPTPGRSRTAPRQRRWGIAGNDAGIGCGACRFPLIWKPYGNNEENQHLISLTFTETHTTAN